MVKTPIQSNGCAKESTLFQDFEMNSDEVANLRVYIADLQATNKSLEDRVHSLTKNALAGDLLEETRLKSIIADFTRKIDIMTSTLEGSQQKIGEFSFFWAVKLRKKGKTTTTESDEENRKLSEKERRMKRKTRGHTQQGRIPSSSCRHLFPTQNCHLV